jgi:hypothetical protein
MVHSYVCLLAVRGAEMLSAARVVEATEQEHESNLASLERQIEMRLGAISDHTQFLKAGLRTRQCCA